MAKRKIFYNKLEKKENIEENKIEIEVCVPVTMVLYNITLLTLILSYKLFYN